MSKRGVPKAVKQTDVRIEDLFLDMGDLGIFSLEDRGDLGFDIFKKGEKEKLCWLNSKGERMLFNWLKDKQGIDK